MFLVQRLSLQQMSQKKIKLTEINFENACIYTHMYSLQHISIILLNVKNGLCEQINCIWWKPDLQIYSYVLLKTLHICIYLASS